MYPASNLKLLSMQSTTFDCFLTISGSLLNVKSQFLSLWASNALPILTVDRPLQFFDSLWEKDVQRFPRKFELTQKLKCHCFVGLASLAGQVSSKRHWHWIHRHTRKRFLVFSKKDAQVFDWDQNCFQVGAPREVKSLTNESPVLLGPLLWPRRSGPRSCSSCF